MKGALFIFAMTMSSSAYAASYSMICENPRREYIVTYSDGDRVIWVGDGVNETAYTVLAVEKTNLKHIVAAQTPNAGPAVRMNLSPYLRMEYWTDGQLYQTDACRNPA